MLTIKGFYEQLLRSIRRHEETRQNFADIRRTIKPSDRQRVNYIEIPTPKGRKKASQMEEMEEILKNEADRHFAQASSTPVVTQGTADKIKKIILEENPLNWKKNFEP